MVAPILIVMSLIDLSAAFILITLPARVSVSILSFPISYSFAFYFGIMMLIKGIYSIIWGIIGADA